MTPIKIRYRVRNRKTGERLVAVLTIQEIESQGFLPPGFKDWLDWEVLSRDMFTGPCDRNGKEIFENDMCKVYDYPPAPIEFAQGSFWIHTTDGVKPLHIFDCGAEIEVIGNIYEQPAEPSQAAPAAGNDQAICESMADPMDKKPLGGG